LAPDRTISDPHQLGLLPFISIVALLMATPNRGGWADEDNRVVDPQVEWLAATDAFASTR
jgi:hypothetical protein